MRLSPLEQVIQVLAARAGTSALVYQIQRVPFNGRIESDATRRAQRLASRVGA